MSLGRYYISPNMQPLRKIARAPFAPGLVGTFQDSEAGSGRHALAPRSDLPASEAGFSAAMRRKKGRAPADDTRALVQGPRRPGEYETVAAAPRNLEHLPQGSCQLAKVSIRRARRQNCFPT